MRTFLVLICSLALACAAGGAQDKNKSKKPAPKKSQAQSTQHAAAPGGGPQKTKGSQHGTKMGGTPVSGGGQKTKGKAAKGSQYVTASGGYSASSGAQKTKKAKGSQQIATRGGQVVGGGQQKTKGSQQVVAAGKYTGSSTYSKKTKQSKWSATSAAAFQSSSKRYKAHQFNLQANTRPAAVAGVTFQQNRHIQGSQTWQGSNYRVFRNYSSQWHERNWWRNR